MNRLLALAGLLSLAFVSSACPALAAPGVSAQIQATITGRYSGASALGSVGADLSVKVPFQLFPGTSTGQADKMFADSRTLASAASENLDLAGVLTDPLGASLTFGHVKAIYIKAAAGNVNAVVVGGATSNAFVGPFGGTTPTVSIPPGGVAIFVHPGAGWSVTPSTGDLLKVLNGGSGSTVGYDVILIGTSS